MDCKSNNIDQLSFEYNAIQENWNSEQFYRLDKEMEDVKSKLLEQQKDCEYTEMEVFNVNQLKDKGTHVLQSVERKYNDLDEDLREIHCNYIKCISKVNSTDEMIHEKINSLSLQKENLKRELDELKKVADENNKKLTDIKKMITIQEKKNMALARKLKRTAQNMHITPDLKNRVNTILFDPRITNVKDCN